MKNFKFNIKLTAFLVSLFIGLLLIILGSKNSYCLCFGFIFMAISLAVYALHYTEQADKAIRELNESMEEINNEEDLNDENIYILNEYNLAKKKMNKRKNRVRTLFYLASILLFVLSFASFL